MPATIPDLWSDDIRADVLTPLAILRTQAALLSNKTRGLITAEVMTTTARHWARHQLDLVAHSLERYRVSILTAGHRLADVYPVTVTSQAFVHDTESEEEGGREAATEEEFIALVRDVLRSDIVRSRIQSLIARSNEVQESAPPPEAAAPRTEEDA